MRAGDVMMKNLLTTESSTPLQTAAERMADRGIGAILVVSGEAVVGILTERDVLRAVAQGGVDGTSVAAWMTRDPETVQTDTSLAEAASLMVRGGYRHLPVVDGTRAVGIVSIRDLMRVVVDEDEV